MTQANILAASGSQGVTQGFKNRILNGACVIDQRNAGASVTPAATSVYTLDRWVAVTAQASKISVQQNAGSVTPPVGFSNYLGVTSLSAYSVLTGDYFTIAQYVEGFNTADLGWGTANAKTVTLSFQVYSSLTGTFGGSLRNSAANRSYPFTYSIPVANTWTTISVTIAGDTIGTWVGATNGVGLGIFFGLGAGSTMSGTAGTWASANYLSATGATSVVGTSGATFYITGIQLEVGSSATGFEYRQYGQELALCQRYLPAFNASNNFTGAAVVCGGFASNTTSFTGIFTHPVPTRVPPTGIVVSANGDFTVNLAGSGQTGTFTYAYASVLSTSINITQTSRTAGQGGYAYGNTSSAYFYLTGCEL